MKSLTLSLLSYLGPSFPVCRGSYIWIETLPSTGLSPGLALYADLINTPATSSSTPMIKMVPQAGKLLNSIGHCKRLSLNLTLVN